MKRNDESGFGIRSETGDIYTLTKKERILTVELLKLILGTPSGRNFLIERFGKEGIKRAKGLLEEMGIQVEPQNSPKQNPLS